MWWRPSRTAPSIWGNVTCALCWSERRLFCEKFAWRASTGELRDGRPLPAQRHQHDLGRDAETERHDAAAETAGDDDIAVHADVTIGEKWPGRRHRRPAEQADLAAMGMAGKLQRHPRRHALGDIRLMRQQNDRRIVRDSCQRRAEIVDTDAPHRAEMARRHIGELIAEAG